MTTIDIKVFQHIFITTVIGAITLLESGLEQNNQLIADNNAKMYEAQLHAQGLENQVTQYIKGFDMVAILNGLLIFDLTL